VDTLRFAHPTGILDTVIAGREATKQSRFSSWLWIASLRFARNDGGYSGNDQPIGTAT
jgi:hypothetical protein